MNKYVFCMMAAVIASGMTACSSNDELLPESSVEQSTPSPYATIRTSFGEQDVTTRVAMDGLSLSWSEGDEIGVVYYHETSGEYKAVKYQYSDGGKFKVSNEADLEGNLTPAGCAFYPYDKDVTYSEENGLSSLYEATYYEGNVDTSVDKIKLPLISTDYDDTSHLYTFKAACSIFAVKVKNLAKDMGYRNAMLYDATGYTIGHFYMKWMNGEWVYTSSGYNYIYSLSNITYGEEGTVDQTFYFPLPKDTYSDLTFALVAGNNKVGFTLKDDLPVENVNVKYAKVIELESDPTSDNYGKRKDDAITLAKCELEVSNTVSVDLKNAAGEETFYIPESVKGGTSVDITASNAQGNRTVYLKQEEDVKTAKDVNLYFDDSSFSSSLHIDLPNSNVYFGVPEGKTNYEFYGKLVVEKAKSFIWGKGVLAYMGGTSCFKDVSEVIVDCSSNDHNTIEGTAEGEEPRTMTLTINNTFRDNTITGNIILTVVNNTSDDVTFNDKAITALANATTVLHIVDGNLVGD